MLRGTSLTVILVAVLNLVFSLTDEDRSCLAANGNALNNDFLVGTWYEVYGISKSSARGHSVYCREHYFNKLREEEVHHYEFLFKILNIPTKLINPLYTRDSYNVTYGILSGANEGKIFIMDPKYLIWRPDHTEGWVYKYINDNVVLYHRCDDDDERKLLSKSRELDDEVVKNILNDPE